MDASRSGVEASLTGSTLGPSSSPQPPSANTATNNDAAPRTGDVLNRGHRSRCPCPCSVFVLSIRSPFFWPVASVVKSAEMARSSTDGGGVRLSQVSLQDKTLGARDEPYRTRSSKFSDGPLPIWRSRGGLRSHPRSGRGSRPGGPLPCSREPCQTAKFAERAPWSVWARGGGDAPCPLWNC